MNQNTNMQPQRLAYTMKDAAHAVSLSKSKLYLMIADGTLRSLKVAGRRLIPADALHDLLKPQMTACSA